MEASSATLKVHGSEAFDHDNFPLIHLPAELRNGFDGFLFESSKILEHHDIVWKSRLPTILFVCRQTYADTKLLL
jgi:hypothetical protein